MRIAAVALLLPFVATPARADVAEPTQEETPAESVAPPVPPAPPAPQIVVGPPGLAAPALREREHAHRYSLMLEPVLLFVTTMGLDVELAATDNVGIVLQGGLGSTSQVTIGDRVHTYGRGDTFADLHDVSFTRLHAGVQTNLYFSAPFKGPHAGIELGYKHFASDDEKRADISAQTASLYLGWKWITASGFTAVLQFGASIVRKQDDDQMPGWQRDTDGTLGPLHLFASAGAGWSN